MALGDADLVAEMLRRVAALAMRRAAGLEALRGLAPLVAVLRVRVRRVEVGAQLGEEVHDARQVALVVIRLLRPFESD